MLHGNRPRRGETLKYRELSYVPGTPVSAESGSLGAAIKLLCEARRSRFLGFLALAVMTLGILIPSYGQGTAPFNCPSGFASTGGCKAVLDGNDCGANFSTVDGTSPQGVVGTPTYLMLTVRLHTTSEKGGQR
jgi:hypothetical protein